MEREVGGGIGMGNTCKSMAVSFQCMTKSTTIIIIIIIIIKEKKKKRNPKSELHFPVTEIFSPLQFFLNFFLHFNAIHILIQRNKAK